MIRFRLMLARASRPAMKVDSAGRFGLLSFRPALAAFSIFILVFFSATSAYAYGSDQVARGNILYPLKISLERVQDQLTSDPIKKIDLHNEFAKRRLAEAQFLSQELSPAFATGTAVSQDSKQQEFNDTIVEANEEIDRTNEMAAALPDEQERDQAFTGLAEFNFNQVEAVSKIAGRFGLNADDETIDHLALTLENLKRHQRQAIEAISRTKGASEKIKDGSSTPETGANAQEQDDSSASSTDPSQAEQSLNRIRQEIDDLSQDQTRASIPEKQARRLNDKLRNKLKKAEQAIKDGDLKKFNGLLQSAEALSNNRKHFLRPSAAEDNGGENIQPAGGFKIENKERIREDIKKMLEKKREDEKQAAEKIKEERQKEDRDGSGQATASTSPIEETPKPGEENKTASSSPEIRRD